ncbi:hypothetical protein EJB05_03125, partial [Eragrostis curvula]
VVLINFLPWRWRDKTRGQGRPVRYGDRRRALLASLKRNEGNDPSLEDPKSGYRASSVKKARKLEASEPQEQDDFNQNSSFDSPHTQHPKSSFDSGKFSDKEELDCGSSDDELDYGSSDMSHLSVRDHFDACVNYVLPDPMPEWKLNKDLLEPPILSKEQEEAEALNMKRRKEITEFDPKLRIHVPTRFCRFNIAYFDFDKESEVKSGPLFKDIPDSEFWKLDGSMNVISIKVAQSDVSYPINIYGTVLARDQNDYRCVYLFKRGRDDPQLITETDDTLTLTGPYRVLSGLDSIFFEFHLKIRGDEGIDQDFSKGLLVCEGCCDTRESRTLSLESWLSTVEMLYTPAPLAVQASIQVNVLNGKSNFIGKIAASTGEDKNKIILYDSKVASTLLSLGDGGSILLTRSVVAVSHNEKLALKMYVSEADVSKKVKLCFGHFDEEQTCTLGSYQLQVKIIWTGVFRQERPDMWMDFKHLVLS